MWGLGEKWAGGVEKRTVGPGAESGDDVSRGLPPARPWSHFSGSPCPSTQGQANCSAEAPVQPATDYYFHFYRLCD